MNEKPWLQVLGSCSDNRKSKTCPEPCRRIENLKWVGIFAIALTFAFGGVVAEAQQPNKVQLIGYISSQDPRIDSAVPRQFA